jgi:hypothetical protein
MEPLNENPRVTQESHPERFTILGGQCPRQQFEARIRARRKCHPHRMAFLLHLFLKSSQIRRIGMLLPVLRTASGKAPVFHACARSGLAAILNRNWSLPPERELRSALRSESSCQPDRFPVLSVLLPIAQRLRASRTELRMRSPGKLGYGAVIVGPTVSPNQTGR